VLVSLGVGAALTVVLILAIGPGRRCDITPQCPPGRFCTAVRIVGPCPLSLGDVGIAVGAGILAGVVMYRRKR
jgi:hypothetical protein